MYENEDIILGKLRTNREALENMAFKLSIDVREKEFGAKCDGGASQSGTISTGAAVTDNTPPAKLPVEGQPVSWVGIGNNVGNGISSITWSSSVNPLISTNVSHNLALTSADGDQQVLIAGVLGATQANGLFRAVRQSASTFSIPLNVSKFGPYTSGGTVRPVAYLYGYVHNPLVTNGILTFSITATPGGANITIPTNLLPTGAYYFGTDDTDAWKAAIAKAATISTTSNNPVRVRWSGVSMISSTLIVDGDVIIEGDHIDYTNPDGTTSSSTLPSRGSVLRPHANFTLKGNSPLVQLGTVVATTSGRAGASTLYGVFDGANIVQDAVKTLGSRNFIERSYACNGIRSSYYWQGSNTIGINPIAGQSNTGDGLVIYGSDSKWFGGYIRQATNAIRIVGGGDFHLGGAVHIFNGYNGGNEQAGNDVLIDASSAAVKGIILGHVVFDGVQGAQVRIAPASNRAVSGVNIAGGYFFQPQASNDLDFPVIQLDTTLSGSGIYDVNISSYLCLGMSTSCRYKSILDTIGTNSFGINLGSGIAKYCGTHYTGQRPNAIANNIIVRNDAASQYAEARGIANFVGDNAASQFTISHSLSGLPNDVTITPMNSNSIGAWATVTATDIVFNFSTPPSNAVALKFGYRAAI